VSLTREQVRHVAQLARLSLSEDEERLYAAQLSQVLEAMAALAEVDTSGVEATSHASSAAGGSRPDEPEPSLSPEGAVAGAPARVGTAFSVPRILE